MTRTVWNDHAFVVPAYGDSPFLAGCLRSLLTQTVRSRVIVATSTPSAFITEAARAAGAEVHVNPKREGIGADWNFALSVAGCRYVTLAHQDDIYYPNFLVRTRDLFAGSADGVLAFTGFRQIGDGGEAKTSLASLVKHLLSAVILGGQSRIAGQRQKLFLSFGNPLPCSAVTFDLERLAGFKFSTDLASNLDWDAWWRLHLQNRPFLHAPASLVGRRYNDLTETSRLIRDGRRQAEDAAMFARIWPKPVAAFLGVLYSACYGRAGGRLVRFGVVGLGLTVLSYVLFVGLLGLGAHYLVASTAGWAVGVIVSYYLNKGFTFALGTRFSLREFITFAGGYVAQLALASIGYVVLIGGFGLGPTPAFLINLAMVATFSFVFMQSVVFRRNG